MRILTKSSTSDSQMSNWQLAVHFLTLTACLSLFALISLAFLVLERLESAANFTSSLSCAHSQSIRAFCPNGRYQVISSIAQRIGASQSLYFV
jgi:Cu/Ag efflux pump CusA